MAEQQSEDYLFSVEVRDLKTDCDIRISKIGAIMEEFDFSAPINATIIYDDSDDETSTEDLQLKEVNNISNNTFEKPDLNSKEKEFENNVSVVAKPGSLDSIKIKRIVTKSQWVVVNDNVPETGVPKNHESKQTYLDMSSPDDGNLPINKLNTLLDKVNKEPEDIHYKQLKRKKRKTIDKRRKKRQSKKTHTNSEIETAAVTKHSSHNTEINLNTLQSPKTNASTCDHYIQSQDIQSQQQNLQIQSTHPRSINDNHHVTHSPQEAESNVLDLSLRAKSSFIANYQKELLNTISENMIYIINSYDTYIKIYRANNVQNIIENAKNDFLRTKYYFFDISYIPVVDIIIPRENDTTFVNAFIKSTINLAHSKSYKYSYTQVKALYMDMITWVKKKQENLLSSILNARLYPLLTRCLQAHTAPPSYADHYRLQQFQKSTTPIGTQNLGIVSNMSSTQPSQTSGRPLNREQIDVEKQIGQHCVPNYSCCSALITKQSQQKPKESNDSRAYCTDQNSCRLDGNQNQSLLTQVNLQPTQYLNNNSSAACSCYQSVQSLPVESQELNSTGTNPHRQDLATNAEPIRSSISRDSGFISSPDFSSSADPLSNIQEEQYLQSTPLITHVTSLNPNISYISAGFCTVCGKSTRKKCLGCYKCYYCSENCQSLDWKKHMPACQTRSGRQNE